LWFNFVQFEGVVIRPRVLIIDVDRRTVDKLQEKFTQLGYEAEIALSGSVGLSIVAERRMSVAILSAKIGHSEDWELVRKLKTHDPKLPVVLFNAPNVKGLSKEARRAGCAKFLVLDSDSEKLLNETVKVMRN
jgi:DNA-binding NtrC family response regulator